MSEYVAERPLDEGMTSPAIDSVRVYLNNIGRTPLLNAEEETELSKRIEAGVFAARLLLQPPDGISDNLEQAMQNPDYLAELGRLAADGEQAKAHLVEANLRLVVSLAKRYTGRGMPLLDLIQEGNLGLIRAVEKFDYQKGFKFSTYATWWIKQAINRGMADQQRTIRLPVHTVEVVNKLSRIAREMSASLSRRPTDEELALEVGMSPEKVRQHLNWARDPLSLEQPVGHDDSASQLSDFLEEDDAPGVDRTAAGALFAQDMRCAISMLPPRYAEVIRRRFGIDRQPQTLEQIGEVLGVTRERVRQIEKTALNELRQGSMGEFLRGYAKQDDS